MVMSAVLWVEASGRCESTLMFRLPPVFTPGITSVGASCCAARVPAPAMRPIATHRNFVIRILRSGWLLEIPPGDIALVPTFFAFRLFGTAKQRAAVLA